MEQQNDNGHVPHTIVVGCRNKHGGGKPQMINEDESKFSHRDGPSGLWEACLGIETVPANGVGDNTNALIMPLGTPKQLKRSMVHFEWSIVGSHDPDKLI
ncbi:hypothetical protein O1611_g2954 [Lasiodiplodia mahajangana]|uniref:Uncharacterized protein n=1 Tax=Lasiodiplodia mahajangana TaxID=1108764 RepID=A0ACC2JTK7_9PEZI|nr:hypothetical protein O1611_g2954 [Lasiodiplodia mahajangana]